MILKSLLRAYQSFLSVLGEDLFYVADRLVNILDAGDKDLRKEVEEFRSEIFHNIGANAVHDHNN